MNKNKKIIFLITFLSFANCMEVDSGASSSTGKRGLENPEMPEAKDARLYINNHDRLKSIFEKHGCGRVDISVDREENFLQLSFVMVKQSMIAFFQEITFYMSQEHVPQEIPDCEEHCISIDQAIEILEGNIGLITTMQIAYVNHGLPSHLHVYDISRRYPKDRLYTATDVAAFFDNLWPRLEHNRIIKERIERIKHIQNGQT